MKSILVGVVAFVLSIFGGHQAVTNSASSAAAAAASVAPSAIVATSSAHDAASISAPPKIINQPVIERVVERTVQTVAPSDGYVTESEFTTRLNELLDRFGRIISGSTYPAPTSTFASGGVWNAVALTNRIDHLSGTNLNDITVSGVSGLTNADIPDLSGSYLSIASTSAARNTLGLSYASASDILKSTNIAAWGDSLTSGAGGTPYTTTLSSLSGYTVYDGGIGGETSTQIRTRMLAATDKYSYATIIWAGRNNYTDPTTVKVDIAAMVAVLGHSNYLVLSVLNGDSSTEWIGGPNYNTLIQLNEDLASIYGDHYLDVRSYLVSQYDPGNSQDALDHAHDIPPNSLRSDSDGVHLNTAGYTKVANYIYTNFEKLRSSQKVLTAQNLLNFYFPRLGVGTSTPAAQFEVFGGSNTDTAIYISNTGVNTTNKTLSLVFRHDVGDTVNAGQDGAGGRIVSGRDGLYGGSILTHNSNLQFWTASAGADAERMRITNSGMVGIGTTSPAATLDIAGTPTNNTIKLLQLSGVSATRSTTTRMVLLSDGRLGLGTSTPPYQLTVNGLTSSGLYNSSIFGVSQTQGGNKTILVSDNTINASVTSSGALSSLVLQNVRGGNVGIGTTSPYALLSVSNSASTAANTPLFVIASTTGGTATTTVLSVASTGNVTIVGSAATCTLGNGASATNCSSSDQRLKDNIAALDASSSLAAIDHLNPVSFNWNPWMVDNGAATSTQFGFIAQEIMNTFPNLVTLDTNTHYYKLDYQGLSLPSWVQYRRWRTRLPTLLIHLRPRN